MIEKVDNYKLIVESGVLELQGSRLYKALQEKNLKREYKDYLEVLANPKLLEDDKALVDYGTGVISKAMLKKALGIESWVKYSNLINKAQDYRTTAIGSFRQMRCIWITGASGTGKSTLSRFLMLKKFGDGDFGTSGNEGHIFDTYDGQSGFILEEFRSSTMRFSSLLTAIDNDNNSATEARYAPKDFSNCRLVIINSITNPQGAYSMFQDIKNGDSGCEPIKQLIRRLDHRYLYIKQDGTIEWVILDDVGSVLNRVPVPNLKMKQVFDYMSALRDKAKIDMSDILGEPIPKEGNEIELEDLPF